MGHGFEPWVSRPRSSVLDLGYQVPFWVSFHSMVIIKYDKKLLQNVTDIIKYDDYYKVWWKVTTKCDSYYKVRQVLQSVTKIH